MRVINFDSMSINIVDTTDDRLPHGVQDLFTPEDFFKFFGIDYTGYVNVVYEPYRKLYIVEKEGGEMPQSFESPEDEKILKTIHEKSQEIMDFLVLRHLKKELPSPYHKIENFKYILPKEHEEAYQKYLDEKKAWKYLQRTFWIALRDLETGGHAMKAINGEDVQKASLPKPEIMDVMRKRNEAYNEISDIFILRALGLKESPLSVMREKISPNSNKKIDDCTPEELKKINEGK
jgi:hypothetical protein